MRHPEGFTLIELLVAITIVGIVFAIVITSAAAVKRSSRDAQRQSDLRSIQSALEQYFADQQNYPTTLVSGAPLCFKSSQSTSCSKTYLNVIPQDPISSNPPYKYTPLPSGCDNQTTNCVNYCLYAKLENTPPVPISPASCLPLPSQYNFLVAQP